ncbi:MAG: YraN family protein [Bacteroidota bacterium]
MNEHNELGKSGEITASEYLLSKGYVILEQNWRSGSWEIDIIAKEKDILVIVEVKSRSSNYFGEPYMAVTKQKQRLLIKAAEAYIMRKNLNYEVRFDIISINYFKGEPTINHIENAFYPTVR